MSQLSLVVTEGFPSQEPNDKSLSLGWREWIMLGEAAVGFLLIMVTVWTPRPLQTRFFRITAAWLVLCAVMSLARNGIPRFRLPSFKVWACLISSALLLATGLVGLAAAAGTLHGLFGVQEPLRHASSYLVWAII